MWKCEPVLPVNQAHMFHISQSPNHGLQQLSILPFIAGTANHYHFKEIHFCTLTSLCILWLPSLEKQETVWTADTPWCTSNHLISLGTSVVAL